jgi:hypothetical protein
VSIDGVFTLIGAVVLAAFGLVTVARAVPWWLRQRRVRRAGRAVVGEVTALDPKYRAYYGLYQLTPVVRYDVDGHSHEARVANQSGAVEIGSSLDLFLDPADPGTPFTAYGQAISGALAVGVGFTLFALVMGIWALHWN